MSGPEYAEFCRWRESVAHPGISDAVARFPGVPVAVLSGWLSGWLRREQG